MLVLHVGRDILNCNMGGVLLEEQDLGIMVAKSFKSNKQCNMAASKTERALGAIKKNCHKQGQSCNYKII